MPVRQQVYSIGCGSVATARTLCSPVGKLKVTYCPSGLHSLHLEKNVSDQDLLVVADGMRVELVGEYSKPYDGVLASCIEWLDCYFNHPDRLAGTPMPAICWNSTDSSFRGMCLRNLGNAAHFGVTISYTDLATAAGNASASRAAGTAMSTNPIGIIIPCHRVVPKSGGVGNYAGGSQVKRFLLAHEAKHGFLKPPFMAG